MSASSDMTCARTNAVLAVHLDGELIDNEIEREQFGYAFLSDDSLQQHLRECSACKQALQRARRLDAVLASGSGRWVADQANTLRESLDAQANRLLERAIHTATETPSALRVDGPPPATDALAGSRLGTWVALASLTAAAALIWFCFAPFAFTIAEPRVDGAAEAEPVAVKPGHATVAIIPPEADVSPEADLTTTAPHAPTQRGPRRDHSSPSPLAQRMRRSRERELPSQRTASLSELAARMGSPEASAPERLAAARQLIRATRIGSTNARNAADELLFALSGCADLDDQEVTIHAQLLDMLRSDRALMKTIEHRLLALLERRDLRAAPKATTCTIVVATRAGSQQLDSVLRRLLNRHDEIGQLIVSGVRSVARQQGACELLLDCWRDQVAAGNQQSTPKWARFWFADQPAMRFEVLAHLRAASPSHDDRVRCCLAMGCAKDDTTLPALLAALHSPQRDEASAAAWGIAMLPHEVLRPLVPTAKAPRANLLRAILARASLPAAEPWLRQLGLREVQLQLLREGPIRRFPEAVNWFRSSVPFSD